MNPDHPDAEAGSQPDPEPAEVYSPDEEQLVAERLMALGYLE